MKSRARRVVGDVSGFRGQRSRKCESCGAGSGSGQEGSAVHVREDSMSHSSGDDLSLWAGGLGSVH